MSYFLFGGDGMTDEEAFKFYNSTLWRNTRKAALKRDNFECQMCKSKGRYSKAVIVHHKKHLKDSPELALSLDNLVSVCKACHEELHPEAQKQNVNKWKEPLTIERWD